MICRKETQESLGKYWENPKVEITVAITGASGSVYAYRFLNHLVTEPAVTKVNVVASTSGIRVLN